MGKNEGVWKIWGSLEEYGWWGNWGVFGSLGSWLKSGEYGMSEEVWKEEWGNVLG